MKVAVDITPITNEEAGHKVRGVGFYLEYLKRSLIAYFPQHEYVFFSRGEQIPNDIDLVHYPYFEPFFLTLPTNMKQARVVTVHDLTPLVFPAHFPSGIKGSLKWAVQKHNLKKSNFIITDSAASRKDIEHIAGIPSEKIEVAYLAAADEFRQLEKGAWRRDIREKYNLPEKFALYVGDVTWNKNVPNLMKAVKEANITLVMVGRALSNDDFDRTNPWNSDLVKVNELLRNDLRFIRLGFLPTEDLVALYNLALVFVFPSVYEGFGLPILEAMQSGCPVVTTKGGSIPEVAGDGAYMVDGYNTKSIAKGISDVFYNYQLRDELIVKGLTQAKKFSWQKTAEKTIEAYKKALK